MPLRPVWLSAEFGLLWTAALAMIGLRLAARTPPITSEAARVMGLFDPRAYGPTFQALLRKAPLGPLDPGRPDFAKKALLEALAGDDAFLPGRVADREAPTLAGRGFGCFTISFPNRTHSVRNCKMPTAPTGTL